MKQILMTVAALLHTASHTETPPSQSYLDMVQHIRTRDVAAFNTELAQATLSAQERAKLADLARAEQTQVRAELELLGTQKIRWSLVGKGLLQLMGASYCAGNTFVTIWSGVETAKRDMDSLYHIADETTTIIAPRYIDKLIDGNHFTNLLAILIHPPLTLYREIYNLHPYNDWIASHPQYVNFFVPTTLTIASLWATYAFAHASIHNVKSGWNYRALLEKQIEQLGQMIAALESKNTL